MKVCYWAGDTGDIFKITNHLRDRYDVELLYRGLDFRADIATVFGHCALKQRWACDPIHFMISAVSSSALHLAVLQGIQHPGSSPYHLKLRGLCPLLRS